MSSFDARLFTALFFFTFSAELFAQNSGKEPFFEKDMGAYRPLQDFVIDASGKKCIKRYFPSGKIKMEFCEVRGKKVGPYKQYYEDGMVAVDAKFDDQSDLIFLSRFVKPKVRLVFLEKKGDLYEFESYNQYEPGKYNLWKRGTIKKFNPAEWSQTFAKNHGSGDTRDKPSSLMEPEVIAPDPYTKMRYIPVKMKNFDFDSVLFEELEYENGLAHGTHVHYDKKRKTKTIKVFERGVMKSETKEAMK